MFEKLVVSTTQRRKHRTAKFFVGTVLLYAIALGCAFIVSVVVSDPKLADTSSVLILVGPPLLSGGTPPRIRTVRCPARGGARPDLNHPMPLDQIMGHHDNRPPTLTYLLPGDSDLSNPGGPPGPGIGPGVPFGVTNGEPPPRPDPPPVKPAANTIVTDNRPMRVTSNVLQGKAIERRVPVYPELVRRIHLQGDVAVEVIISPEGRVESARAISGHPMLIATALEAARGWRFGPTILNGVPVRVTGVITFVFKLTE